MKPKPKRRLKAKSRIKVKSGIKARGGMKTSSNLNAKLKTKAGASAGSKSNLKPRTVDEYFARLGDDQRAALENLRKNILAAAPAAVECISYQLPAFRLDGRLLVAFGAWANHCAFYPGAVIEDLGVELKGYDISKGTIRFLSTDPLPATLVRKLVKARIAGNKSKQRHAEARAARSR